MVSAEKINFRVGTVEEATASADFVCANLTADVIIDDICLLLVCLSLAGIWFSQEFSIRRSERCSARLLECGMSAPRETMQDGEWVAIVV